MTVTPDTARAWVDVDLGALAANARALVALTGSRLLPMIKANAYGLGAPAVVDALEPLEPWGYGVACVEEGAALRRVGVARPVLALSPLLAADIDAYLSHDIRPAIGDPLALDAWCRRTAQPFHLEIDTGMGRAGIRWNDTSALTAAAALLHEAPGWEGVFTHFHSADVDPGATATQWARLQGVLTTLPRRPALVHAANSAGALAGRVYAGDLIRPGIYLYGGSAGSTSRPPAPVAALRARVLAVRRLDTGDSVSYGATWRASRPTTVATLGLGYADGFLRADAPGGSGRPPRLIQLDGRLGTVIGRVTMDMTMIDVGTTGGSEPQPGDVATVYGGCVTLDQQAAAAGTIAYEMLTALGARVPRHYRRDS